VKPSAGLSAVGFHSTLILPASTSWRSLTLTLKLRLDAIDVALSEAYSLRVVAPESLLSVKREADVAAEAIIILRFNASSRESVQLSRSKRSTFHSLE
jgi:hypothetical protein